MQYFLFLLFLLCYAWGYTQDSSHTAPWVKKLADKVLFNQEKEQDFRIVALPNFSFSPEHGFAFGASAFGTYRNQKSYFAHPSFIDAQAIYSTKKTAIINLKNHLWLNHNKWFIRNSIYIRQSPSAFFGIGNHSKAADKEILRERKIIVDNSIDKKVSSSQFLGISIRYENYHYTPLQNDGIYTREGHYIHNNGHIMLLGIRYSLDTRNNISSSTKGSYFKTQLSIAPDFWGQSHFYRGSFLSIDARQFFRLTPQFTLGLHAISNNTLSDDTLPFFLLQQLGNDEIMRGYYQGRFRDRHYVAVQSEIRYRPLPLLGLAIFGGMGEVFGSSPFQLQTLKPSYGAGMRLFFDQQKQHCLRIDYAIGAEKQSGFYISFNEAF